MWSVEHMTECFKNKLQSDQSAFHTSSVLGVVPPVRQVNLGCAGDDQLQLPGVKYRHQPGVHHLENTQILMSSEEC